MIIVVPMAGRGSRFTRQGITIPKQFISVADRPMLAWALKSLENLPFSSIIFIALREHEEKYNIRNQLYKLVNSKFDLILLDSITEGQLCTVLAAEDFINNDEDLLIASSDTYVVSNLRESIQNRREDCHGIISVANLPGDRWSFARVDTNNRVVEVAEKVRISEMASTGLYYFSSGKELVTISKQMIEASETTRGEYYVIPVYQKMIERGWRIDVDLASEAWDMGTPNSLEQFEAALRNSNQLRRADMLATNTNWSEKLSATSDNNERG